MNLQFTVPTDRANLDLFFTFPATSFDGSDLEVTLSGAGASQVLVVCLSSFVEINAVPTFCGRITLASPLSQVNLSTLINSTIAVKIDGVDVEAPVTVQAFAQTSKRALTSINVTQGA